MYTHSNYILDEKEFNYSYKSIESIYHTITVVEIFCTYYAEIEEISNITPIINYIRKEADILYSKFINMQN